MCNTTTLNEISATVAQLKKSVQALSDDALHVWSHEPSDETLLTLHHLGLAADSLDTLSENIDQLTTLSLQPA